MTLRSTSLLLALASIGRLACAQEVRVLQAGAGWSSPKGPISKAVKSVPADADLTGTASAANLILDCQRFGWRLYSCKGAACKIGVCADSAPGVNVLPMNPPPSMLAQLVPGADGLKRLADYFLTREIHAPAILAARAGGSPNDALLLEDAKGVHWGPALKRVLEGAYCFRLSRLGAAASESKTFMIDWDRAVDPEGIVPVAGLSPGGYVLEKALSRSCASDPEATPAWVVVAPQNRFSQLAPTWEQAAQWAGELEGQGAGLPAVATARHTVLAAMAEVVEKP